MKPQSFFDMPNSPVFQLHFATKPSMDGPREESTQFAYAVN